MTDELSNEEEIERGLASVAITLDGNGEIIDLEIIDGRFSDQFVIENIISADKSKCRTMRVFAGYRNGGDSLEETDQYDSGTLFADNLK